MMLPALDAFCNASGRSAKGGRTRDQIEATRHAVKCIATSNKKRRTVGGHRF